MLDRLHKAGWKRIGFYLPKVIDWRTAGAFSAAIWRWQQNLPEADHLEVGLPPGYDEEHFGEWFRRVRPQFLIGMPQPSMDWMKRAGIKPVPVAMPASLEPEEAPGITRVDENWEAIYLGAVRLLDSMLRHGERGIPDSPRRTAIAGRWVPGQWGKGSATRGKS